MRHASVATSSYGTSGADASIQRLGRVFFRDVAVLIVLSAFTTLLPTLRGLLRRSNVVVVASSAFPVIRIGVEIATSLADGAKRSTDELVVGSAAVLERLDVVEGSPKLSRAVH